MPKPVAPDDTPTFPDEGRITEVFVNGQKIYLPFDGVLVKKGDVIEVVGGVELRISQPTFEPDDTPTRQRPSDRLILERLWEAEAEVSRLQQENALLKRSLEMLTKQMAEKGV